MDISPVNQPDSEVPLSVAKIKADCLQERAMFREVGIKPSPACVELFRRSFQGDKESRAAIYEILLPLMRAWIKVEERVEPDDIVHSALLNFYRSAPKRPELVETDELGRVVEYLKRCVKSALLEELRRPYELPIDIISVHQSPDELVMNTERRLILRERLNVLLTTEDERDIFHWRFELLMKPQEIVATYGARFSNIKGVYQTIDRITQRLRKDADLQELKGKQVLTSRKSDSKTSLDIKPSTAQGDIEDPEDNHVE